MIPILAGKLNCGFHLALWDAPMEQNPDQVYPDGPEEREEREITPKASALPGRAGPGRGHT